MTIEEVIDRAVMLGQTIEIEYCTRSGSVFTCRISDIVYSQYYGGGYIQAFRDDMGEQRTFKVSRIMKVNGHSFTRIYWNQIGDNFNRI
jgi:predicted DNA-binding transcriptional regulator YafY